MSLQLLGIRFNHDPLDSSRSALNIRRNAWSGVAIPEWTPGTLGAAQSVAAYATDAVDPAQVFLMARFGSPLLRQVAVEIRTVRPQPPDLPLAWQGWLNLLSITDPLAYAAWRDYLGAIWAAAWELGSDLLGQIVPSRIVLDGDGNSGWVVLPLFGNRLREAGVGRHELALRWQWRGPGSVWWEDLQISRHLIYTVLRVPTLPWLQQPFDAINTQLPWVDALERACTWAAGARDPREASSQITRAVYQLGDVGVLEYGCGVGAGAAYSFPHFNLSALLARVAGGVGRGAYVNCSDCATFVSTLANLLGDDLWQSQMGESLIGFSVNPIRAIGTALFAPPCGIGSFRYHEVAWTGAAGDDDSVYDACLELDATVGGLPQALLASHLRFGAAGELQYRDLLAAPWSRNACMARPEMRLRRAVF